MSFNGNVRTLDKVEHNSKYVLENYYVIKGLLDESGADVDDGHTWFIDTHSIKKCIENLKDPVWVGEHENYFTGENIKRERIADYVNEAIETLENWLKEADTERSGYVVIDWY